MVLAHDVDVTEIRKDGFKGRAFKKSPKIAISDIFHFQRLGKRHIYFLDLPEEFMHENDAASIMTDAFYGTGVIWRGEPKEGKLKNICYGLMVAANLPGKSI